jgi:AcrR family transcriptional regulator
MNIAPDLPVDRRLDAIETMNSKRQSVQNRSTEGGEADSEAEFARDIYRILDLQGVESAKFGLREQNKVDKLRRIFSAARRQFAEVGYDATTLRDVAKEAHVALGTLSLYAESKRELVLLVFNATMPAVLEGCRKAGVYDGSLSDAVTAYFRPAYTAYAREPVLFRILLRENVFHTTSAHAREFHRLREETIQDLRNLLVQAREDGEIRPYIDIDLTARTIFYLLFTAVRLWICTDKPTVEAGLAELRSMIALLLDGMRSDGMERAAPRTRVRK